MKILTKFDYILIFFILILAVSFDFILAKNTSQYAENGVVNIYYKDEIYDTIPLNIDTTINIDTETSHNTVEIKDGKVNMIDADCPDKYCVHEKEIEFNNQTIVCLPNRIVVKIESSQESDIDAFVR